MDRPYRAASGRRRGADSYAISEDSGTDSLQQLEPSPLDWTLDLEQGGNLPNASTASGKAAGEGRYEGENAHRHDPIRHVGLSGKGWEYWRTYTLCYSCLELVGGGGREKKNPI